MQLQIPHPCTESWSQMTPVASGRHCAQCAKTVVDFSEMRAEEIALYMQLNAGQDMCGRFRADQLETDLSTAEEYVLHVVKAPLSLLRQIAAIIVFVLFLSAGASPAIAQHAPARQQPVKPSLTAPVSAPAAVDTPRPQPMIMGGIRPYRPMVTDTPHAPKSHYLKGRVAPIHPHK